MLKKVMSEPEFFVRENSRSKIRETLKSFSPGQCCGFCGCVFCCCPDFRHGIQSKLFSQPDGLHHVTN